MSVGLTLWHIHAAQGSTCQQSAPSQPSQCTGRSASATKVTLQGEVPQSGLGRALHTVHLMSEQSHFAGQTVPLSSSGKTCTHTTSSGLGAVTLHRAEGAAPLSGPGRALTHAILDLGTCHLVQLDVQGPSSQLHALYVVPQPGGLPILLLLHCLAQANLCEPHLVLGLCNKVAVNAAVLFMRASHLQRCCCDTACMACGRWPQRGQAHLTELLFQGSYILWDRCGRVGTTRAFCLCSGPSVPGLNTTLCWSSGPFWIPRPLQSSATITRPAMQMHAAVETMQKQTKKGSDLIAKNSLMPGRLSHLGL